MPVFMGVHNVEGGVAATDVAAAHEADLAAQEAHGVNYLKYWVDEEAGKIFCLVEAPDAEAANTVQLLGSPWVDRSDGIAYQVRSRKSWALLACLIFSEQPPARSRLAGPLYAEADDPLRALR